MAVLRLFASAREIAATEKAEFPAETVAEVLEKAQQKYGASFSEVIESSNIWLNGSETDLNVKVCDNDVVAVLPPVSGG